MQSFGQNGPLSWAQSSPHAPNTGGGGALRVLRQAANRRVGFVMIGDSNQLRNGNGFDDGFGYHLAQTYGFYATPLYVPEASGTAMGQQGFASSGVSGATNSADTGAPAELEALALPGSRLDAAGRRYCYQATGDIGNSNGVVLDTGVDVNANLRAHFCYGTFPAGGGSFVPAWRQEVSPFTTLVTGSSVSTTGAYGKSITTLDLPAATRDYNVSAKWKRPGGTASVGPNIQFWACIENTDMDHGVHATSLYGYGGQSLYDMAAWAIAAPDASLVAYFEAIRYLQEQAGQTPLVVMYVNSGLNDRSETSQPSLGPAGVTDPDSPEAYIDNLTALINRIEGVWTAEGWPLSQLTWLIVPSHPVSDPDDAELVSYRAAIATFAAIRSRVDAFYFTDWVTSAEILANGWYASSGADTAHLASATAYRGMAALIDNAL